jgi:hypothetical protein
MKSWAEPRNLSFGFNDAGIEDIPPVGDKKASLSGPFYSSILLMRR